jgi:hypothetical protein
MITTSLLFLYSMETFLPYILNKAKEGRDSTKIKSIGPLACALE